MLVLVIYVCNYVDCICKLSYLGCCCLLASVVFAQGGPKLDLGPLSDGKQYCSSFQMVSMYMNFHSVR